MGPHPRPSGHQSGQAPNVNELTRLLVGPEQEGERLDIFLAGTTQLSRRAARRLVADGLVWRNGDPLRVQSRPLTLGDVVDVLRPAEELGVPSLPEVVTPELLFHDRFLLVAAKPAGVLSQPAENRSLDDPSFDHQVLLALALSTGRRPFLRMLHRLDRMTSGAVIFARSSSALQPLTQAWAEGRVERSYLAVVEGHPKLDSFEIDRPIARDRGHRWRFHCHESGRTAQTRVQIVARLDGGLSAVDTDTEYRIISNFSKWLPGRTCIIVSHRVTPILNADEIIVMDGGRIAARGPHRELLAANDFYRTIYEHQMLTEKSGEPPR